MKKSELKQLIREELNKVTLLPQALEFIKSKYPNFDSLDGIRYDEVEEIPSNEVPPSLLNSLKNMDRLDFQIDGEEGYVLYYNIDSDTVWFENVL
tara:strand:- start:322 stop:606 length:285 start_codon:yes stop_codon:yes gene_type:complete